MTLPIIDLQATDLVDALRYACEEVGFFYIRNHGIALNDQQLPFALARQFFSLSLEEKMQLDVNTSVGHRGYSPLGAEFFEEETCDCKEAFDMGPLIPDDHPDIILGKPMQGPNRYPAISGWQKGVQRYYRLMHDLGHRILVPMALGLGLPPNYFSQHFQRQGSILRLLHYPPQSDAGCAKHTDYGALTILATDGVAGLEIQRRDGSWMKAPTLPNCYIVNIGDLMQRWTDDRYISTPHRVQGIGGVDRYSVPFFFEPHVDTIVHSRKYPAICSGDYIQSRFDATYVYRQPAFSV